MLDLNALNREQLEAVTDTSGRNLMVIAGPGSGKTFTITQRIFFLIQERKVPPEKILVVTFTKDAALSMQERFRSQAEDHLYPVNFGTFHSIFYHILRTSTGTNAAIFTESQKKKLILSVLKKVTDQKIAPSAYSAYPKNDEIVSDDRNRRLPSAETVREAAGHFSEAFSFYKNTGDRPKAKAKVPEEWRAFFEFCFEAYEAERKRRRLLDFDDMVRECRELFDRDQAWKEYWSNRFSDILIDEFQDINPEQYLVIGRLKGENTRIFAVGDDDQSIYGFRGSSPECMERFVKEQDARTVYLTLNYRSTEGIVDAAAKVISGNRKRFGKNLRVAESEKRQKADCTEQDSCRPDGDGRDVVLKGFTDSDEESEYLLGRLHELQKESGRWQCAVLFRTNLLMQGFAAQLSAKGIRYLMKERVTSIYEHFIVKDILAYLKWADKQKNDKRIQSQNKHENGIKWKPGGDAGFPQGETDYADEEQTGKQDHAAEALEDHLRVINRPLRYINREALAGGGEDIFERIRSYYRNQSTVPYRAERIAAVDRLEKDITYMGKLSLYLSVTYLLKSIGYEAFLQREAKGDRTKWQEWQQVLCQVLEDAKRYESVEEWEEGIRRYQEDIRNGNSGQKRQGEEAEEKEVFLHLMTVHGAKGLEFDTVWIPDCNEKIYPHGNMPDMDTVEEERRLFYVAMTRAKRRLELLYLTGTRDRPRSVSRFLQPLFPRAMPQGTPL